MVRVGRCVAFCLVVCVGLAAALIAQDRNDNVPQDAAEIAQLQQWVDQSSQLHLRIKTLVDHGSAASDEEASARYHLYLAQSRLAQARHDERSREQWLVRCVGAADDEVRTRSAAYDEGRIPLAHLLDAMKRRSEAKSQLNALRAER